MTQSIKAKLTILVGVVGLMFLTGCQPIKNHNITHRFTGVVNHETVDALENAMDKAEEVIGTDEIFTLEINSPGGLLTAYRFAMDRLNSTPLKTRTVAKHWVASAGALMFILGDERVMKETSYILFHYVRIHVGENVVIRAHEIREYLRDSSSVSLGVREYLDSLGLWRVMRMLIEFESINLEIYNVVAAKVGAKLADKLLVVGKDIVLTPEEALEMGVATKIEKLERKRVEKKEMRWPNGYMPKSAGI